MILDTPILFLIFNRPDTTKEVFDAIANVRPKKLYIAADGPRNEREALLCQEARAVAQNINWPCEVKTLFRKENLGCMNAVSSAITWFFENEEEGIILEDDCLPSNLFFEFCSKMLIRYRKDNHIMHVGGHMLINSASDEPLLSRLFPIWGWATWRRAWEKFSLDYSMFKSIPKDRFVEWYGIQAHNVYYNLRKYYFLSNTWDAQWSSTAIANNGYSIIAPFNLVTNIGFGPNATNTKISFDSNSMAIESIDSDMEIRYSEKLKYNKQFDIDNLTQLYYRKNILKRIYDQTKAYISFNFT